ncbi:MAG: imidazole glycerol phosphate synthase subunit HisH, partial [Vampirovibrionales bacterium]|nr:imidazole glycerol phosphate synthase subunit HisH [Vampirovibrionales bacterium]
FEGATGLPTGHNPILLPGVGAFGALMQALNQRGLSSTLKTLIAQGTPYLGICVGLQVLFEASEESPGCPGLGVLKGRVKKFTSDAKDSPIKIPQIGWNRIALTQSGSPFDSLAHGAVYFVNSYVAAPEEAHQVLYQADYGGAFCAGVRSGNITAFQFHPEKSGDFGHQLLATWVASVLTRTHPNGTCQPGALAT